METNEAGDVAVVYQRRIPKYVRVGKNEYVFMIQRTISMAFIKPEDVDRLTAMTEDCGCGSHTRKHMFRLANDAEYRIWTGIASR